MPLRHAMMTRAPRRETSTAIENPSPELDPSTSTVFPSMRSVGFNSPAAVCFLNRSLIPVIIAVTGLLYFFFLIGPKYVATYAATKSFSIRLAEALHDELKADGIDIMACCAGTVSVADSLKHMGLKPQADSHPLSTA